MEFFQLHYFFNSLHINRSVMMEKQRKSLTVTASTGKYNRLYTHLRLQDGNEWNTTFNEVEEILGFQLPNSARMHRSWWSNQVNGGHSQAFAWQAAGWRVLTVDLKQESLIFKRINSKEHVVKEISPHRKFDIDKMLPPLDVGPWPEGLEITREWMYGGDD